MGPLDMVLAKDALCEILEKAWGAQSLQRTQRLLSAGGEKDLDVEFKSLGLELMESGKKQAGWDFARVWKSYQSGEQARMPIKPAGGLAALEDDDDEEPSSKQTLAQGFAKGLGKAFAKSSRSTTDELASAGLSTLDNAGSVTEWQGEDELTAAAKRMFADGKVGIALAKAELSAIVRSKLGSKANKIVERVESAKNEPGLALAVGEAQRKLVRASMPRLAAKLAKKWIELHGRIE